MWGGKNYLHCSGIISKASKQTNKQTKSELLGHWEQRFLKSEFPLDRLWASLLSFFGADKLGTAAPKQAPRHVPWIHSGSKGEGTKELSDGEGGWKRAKGKNKIKWGQIKIKNKEWAFVFFFLFLALFLLEWHQGCQGSLSLSLLSVFLPSGGGFLLSNFCKSSPSLSSAPGWESGSLHTWTAQQRWRRTQRHKMLSPCWFTALAGSGLSAVSGVRGGAAAGCGVSGVGGAWGCRSSAGCVSRASCRSRM